MRIGWETTRRTVLRCWVTSLLGKRSAASSANAVDPVSIALRGFAPSAVFQRRYRLDATILLLGAPLFTRKAAGGAYASVEIARETTCTATALQFAAGSDPARAHGLNRFGILREAVVEREPASAPTDLAFAGMMTRAREESFEQARQALRPAEHGAEGVMARGRTTMSDHGPTLETWVENIDLAPDCIWSNLNDTLSEALREAPRNPPRPSMPATACTFLHAMRNAALCADPIFRRQFMHTGKLYWLETRRHPGHPLELAGAIHDLHGARCAEFRTTYADRDPSGIPIRIEYRPRSFLRLTFEAELEVTQPPIPSVFHEENA